MKTAEHKGISKKATYSCFNQFSLFHFFSLSLKIQKNSNTKQQGSLEMNKITKESMFPCFKQTMWAWRTERAASVVSISKSGKISPNRTLKHVFFFYNMY